MKVGELILLLQGVQITFGDIDLEKYLDCGLGCIQRMNTMLHDNALMNKQANPFRERTVK